MLGGGRGTDKAQVHSRDRWTWILELDGPVKRRSIVRFTKIIVNIWRRYWNNIFNIIHLFQQFPIGCFAISDDVISVTSEYCYIRYFCHFRIVLHLFYRKFDWNSAIWNEFIASVRGSGRGVLGIRDTFKKGRDILGIRDTWKNCLGYLRNTEYLKNRGGIS